MNLCITIAIVAVFGYLTHWWCNKLFLALCDLEAARHDLFEWRWSNPGVYLGLSDTGKALLIRTLEAYDTFVRYHPYARDDEYRDFLLGLFNELPPLHRKRLPKPACAGFCFLLSF